mmetsp:Transcript_8497/g.12021  ORF Transcript_8497/g.12021 Transcript_8497/m.12021 type:complete len:432 (+) Transcript_8497:188-1483(+)|eukprot:CAMPEP_0184489802 /NCGR_PEP_ID=MMETSP0113_2-20130426/16402_1 /TAXON_ID=91329 /ORGANISM="Norrisiella sphaerica, Strain BC52" /LENGTH=431 /DNA_ID=CAMNT_0026873425 /DNA_START=98 /DNA_END=1393 /DNA_ORIENTATION=-
MPRAKKVLKRKNQKAANARKNFKKKKEEKKVEIYDPADISKPIPLEYELWGVRKEGSQSIVTPCKIYDRRTRTDVKKIPEGQHEFEYYIHWDGEDRRMDQWIAFSELRFTGPKKEKKVEEDEHHKDHHDDVTKVRNFNEIQIGQYVMPTWYFSPFPVEYSRFSRLLFCEFCLEFFGHKSELERHCKKCTWTHPPGNEIYRSKETNIDVAMFEVDGKKEEKYTQNICYIAKLFLEHKTLSYNTHPFLFYVLCEITTRGCVMVGYFSKEKFSEHNYNLACICTLPCHQKKGFGKFLISMSYELSKLEGRSGSPETPISDLGQKAYNSYWQTKLIEVLSERKEPITINEMCQITSMTMENVTQTLKDLDILHYDNREGHHIAIPESLIKRYREKRAKLEENKERVYVRPVDPKKIRWYPFHAFEINKQARKKLE